jgi:hypothetical protein
MPLNSLSFLDVYAISRKAQLLNSHSTASHGTIFLYQMQVCNISRGGKWLDDTPLC